MKPFAPGDKVCKLCLQEKLSILRSPPSLNKKKEEIFGHCMHKKRFLLNLNNIMMSTDEVLCTDTLSFDKNNIGYVFLTIYIYTYLYIICRACDGLGILWIFFFHANYSKQEQRMPSLF